jgi:NADH-quinone oxidoreductase subunit A
MSVTLQYALVAISIAIAVGLAATILILTHLIGPKRFGARKHATYEAGVEPIGDTRRRFNVRFYLVAVLFLVFDVEIVFLYPWAVLLRDVKAAGLAPGAAAVAPSDALAISTMVGQGYDLTYVVGVAAAFLILLAVGFVYEWRRGIFRWQ